MGVSLHQIQIQVLFQKMGDFVCVVIYFIGDRYAILTFLVIKIMMMQVYLKMETLECMCKYVHYTVNLSKPMLVIDCFFCIVMCKI